MSRATQPAIHTSLPPPSHFRAPGPARPLPRNNSVTTRNSHAPLLTLPCSPQFTRCSPNHPALRPRSKLFGKKDTISKDVKATGQRSTKRI